MPDDTMAAWREWRASPWGRPRYTLAEANLLLAAVRQTDPVAALAALETDQARTRTFDTTLTLHIAEDVGDQLAALGCTVTGHYGIRAFCDYITDDRRKHEPEFFADLERLEPAVTARPPYPHLARQFQLIGTR